jgi:outer membrane protein OmpA-like peptidoglycan-associated protein
VGSAGGTSDRLSLGACLIALGVLAWLCVARHAEALASLRAHVASPLPALLPVTRTPLPEPVALRVEPPPPPPAPLRVQAELDRLLAGGRIDFEPGGERLRADAAPLLDAVAEQLASAPELELEVEAHTDSHGNASANRRLSQRQAQAVKTYLVARGVAPGRILTVGSGSTRPLLRSRTAEASQLNRRIEFRVLAPGSR